ADIYRSVESIAISCPAENNTAVCLIDIAGVVGQSGRRRGCRSWCQRRFGTQYAAYRCTFGRAKIDIGRESIHVILGVRSVPKNYSDILTACGQKEITQPCDVQV